MTTLRRIRANQENARRNTGPRSSGGAGNARTHGLSASKCISEEETQLIEARLADLERELQPEGALQHDEVRAVASASVRLERCQLEEEVWLRHRAERAEFYWPEDRQAEVMVLVQKLPRKPELSAKLRQTLRGAIWMRDEWRDLARQVRGTLSEDPPRPLDETGRRRACDLLGLSAERRLGATPLDPPGGAASEAAVIAHQDALIAAQILDLEALTSDEMAALDESMRVATVLGSAPGIDAQSRLIRRYETEARRVKERALENLARLKEAAARLRKEAREREVVEMLEARCVITPLSRETIDPAARDWEVESQPEAARAPQHGPHVEPAEATPDTGTDTAQPPVTAATVAPEIAPGLTATPADSLAAPFHPIRPMSRRERKTQAAVARAAHRKAR
jgi:hypothetical protein